MSTAEADTTLEPSWQRWVEDRLERECDPQQLVGTLLKNGVPLSSIADSLGDRLTLGTATFEAPDNDVSLPPDPIPGCDWAALMEPPLLRRRPHTLVSVGGDKLQLYTLDDFMTAQECDAFVALVNQQLRPSLITSPTSDKHFRTSRSCDLCFSGDQFIAHIDERIAQTLGIRLSHSEGIEAQRYDIGQQFKEHHDFFEPRTDAYTEFASAQGNRTWTFMVYLTECESGGATSFPAIEKKLLPKKGQAVLWNNLYANGAPNFETLHAGEPVLAGHKVIITKWFREKGQGPMFYED